MSLDEREFLDNKSSFSIKKLISKKLSKKSKKKSKFRADIEAFNNIPKPKTGLKSRDKIETKWRQSRDATRDKVETKWRQSEDKLRTEQKQSRDKVETQLETPVETKWRQSRDKVETINTFSSLMGQQKKITEIIFLEAFKVGSRTTPPMSIDFMHRQSNIAKLSLKKGVQRLKNKGVITRAKVKNGRGGWSQYEISEKLYTEMIQLQTGDKVETKQRQSRDKVETQLGTQLETTPPSSSSNLNITTTTSGCVKTDKNGYLDAIKIPEEIKKIGFRETQVEQISKIGKLSVEELEGSLEHFAFDLGEGHIRAKTNPLNMLMGILRHGVYTSSEYLKEEETALENELRGLRERKKRRDDLLKEKQELLFEEWLEPKSKDEIVAIVPTPMNSNEFYMQGIHKELLFNHFVENEMELFKGFQQ